MVAHVEDIKKRVDALDERITDLEYGFNSKIALLEQAINALQNGVDDINGNLSDIKQLLARQDVVNEYMKDIYITRREFKDVISDLREDIVKLNTKISTRDEDNRGFWEKYGYLIATISALVALFSLFLGHGGV